MRFLDITKKQVVTMEEGRVIGRVIDLELDSCMYKLSAIIVERDSLFNLFYLFKGSQQIIIPFENIVSFGKDVIIVKEF